MGNVIATKENNNLLEILVIVVLACCLIGWLQKDTLDDPKFEEKLQKAQQKEVSY